MRALLAAGCLALCAPPTAAAAGGSWSPPHKLSGDHAGAPLLAAAPSGETVAVWGTQIDGASALGFAVRPPGEGFGRAGTLPTGPAYPSTPAVNAAGDAAVAWEDGSDFTWHLATRAAGADSFEAVNAPATWDTSAWWIASVAVAPGGDVLAVLASLEHRPDGEPTGGLSVVRLREGSFGEPRAIPGAAGRRVIGSALGPDGRLTVVWWERAGDTAVRASSTGTPEAGFAEPEVIPASEGGVGYQGQVEVNERGDMIAMWGTANASALFGLKLAYRPAGGTWSAAREPVPVDRGQSVVEADVAIDREGNALVAWSDGASGRTRLLSAGGRLGPIEHIPDVAVCCGKVGEAAFERSPSVAFAASGAAMVAWSDQSDRAHGVRAAVRAPSGTWQPFESVSDPDAYVANPQLAVDRDGNGVLVWNGNDNAGDQQRGRTWVNASVFDPDAPAVTAFRKRARSFTYHATKPARVTLRVDRSGKTVLVRRTARFARSGQLRATALRPGRYHATLTARSRGGRKAAPRQIDFRVRAR